GTLAVSLSISLRPCQPALDLWEVISGRVAARLREQKPLLWPMSARGPDEAALVHPLMQRAAGAVDEVMSDAALERGLDTARLNLATGAGFLGVPAPAPWRSLVDDDTLCGHSAYPIAWIPAGEDELICSANGHSFTIPASPRLEQLLERLNAGDGGRVAD